MKKFSLLSAFIVLVCLCLWIGFDGIFTLNFAFAILSFVLIVSIVFYAQKRKIQSLIQNASQEELEALSEAYKSKQERLQEEEEEFWGELEVQEDSKILHNPRNLHEQNPSKCNLHRLTQSEQAESQRNFKPQKTLKTRFWHNFSAQNTKTGAKIFFYPLRLFAYGFLIVGILFLISQQFFNALAFFSGLVFANILVVLFLFMRD